LFKVERFPSRRCLQLIQKFGCHLACYFSFNALIKFVCECFKDNNIIGRIVCMNILINFCLPTFYYECLMPHNPKEHSFFLGFTFYPYVFRSKVEVRWEFLLSQLRYIMNQLTFCLDHCPTLFCCASCHLLFSIPFPYPRSNSKSLRILYNYLASLPLDLNLVQTLTHLQITMNFI
jgi:hypothetical protein